MPTASELLDDTFLEMRWRTLSLAADLDRIQRAAPDAVLPADDPRLQTLRRAMQLLLTDIPNRAEQVQLLFSDTTPPPAR
jgi:hypothetical protein